MDHFLIFLAVVLPLIELLGVLAAVHAVMNARTSQGATAWAIALVTLPFVALFLYAVFGRNRFQRIGTGPPAACRSGIGN